MRERIDNASLEYKLNSVENMKGISQLAKETEGLEEDIKNSVLPVKQLLNDIFVWLKWKDKPFYMFDSVKNRDISAMLIPC